jgi:hypothetical protein
MTNNEHSITDRDRYNRFSEDWRFEHKLIWEIPSVTFAILGGLLTISYSWTRSSGSIWTNLGRT